MKLNSYIAREEKVNVTTKAHNLPIFASASFNFENINEGIEIFEGKKEGHVYSRYGNPTMETVAKKIAKMECYNLPEEGFGILTSSGMSAISTLLFAHLQHGDKILTQENLYGGTTELLSKIFQKLGVEVIFTDLTNEISVEAAINKHHNIKMLYCESPANPSLSCIDLSFIGKVGIRENIITVIDNTFCTPYLQRPLEFGFDYSIHSTTKFLNGHGNSIAGIIVGKSKDHYESVWDAMKLIGTNCNAFDAWILNNGIKTLSLRMDKHSANALELSRRLEKNVKVKTVNYPFLDSNPQIAIAKNQMKSGGGMLSFELIGGLESGIKFMNNVKMCSLAPTLGDIDTLILHPASMSHRNVDKKVREKNGITDGLIRVSVGIEDVEDIYSDILQAIDNA